MVTFTRVRHTVLNNVKNAKKNPKNKKLRVTLTLSTEPIIRSLNIRAPQKSGFGTTVPFIFCKSLNKYQIEMVKNMFEKKNPKNEWSQFGLPNAFIRNPNFEQTFYLPIISANQSLSAKCFMATICHNAQPINVPKSGHKPVGYGISTRIISSSSFSHPNTIW